MLNNSFIFYATLLFTVFRVYFHSIDHYADIVCTSEYIVCICLCIFLLCVCIAYSLSLSSHTHSHTHMNVKAKTL